MNFLNIKNKKELLEFLNVTSRQFDYHLYVNKSNSYNSFTIPKKDGSLRIIDVPNDFLKSIQIKLLSEIEKIYKPKDNVYGFVKNKNIKDNAAVHLNRPYLLNIDLKDFFPSINFGRIRGLFKSKPFSFNNVVSTFLANIATNKNGELPQGSPMSPILSNMIAYVLDQEILKEIMNKGIYYTRYADDLTFSSNSKHAFSELSIKNLTATISGCGFEVNTKKINLSRQNNRKEVTGLIVNKHVNVPSYFYNNTRAMIHNSMFDPHSEARKYIEMYPLRNNKKVKKFNNQQLINWFMKVIEGRVRYIKYILGNKNWRYLSIAKKYNELIRYERFDIKKMVYPKKWIEESTCIIESYANDSIVQGTAVYLGNGIFITAAHCIVDNYETLEIYNIGSPKIKVDNNSFEINILYMHTNADLALIQVNGFNLNANIDLIKMDIKDDDVITVAGFPNYSEGSSLTSYNGIIAGTRIFFNHKLTKIDAKIVRGMSGGAVFNSNLDLIGIIVRGNISKDSNSEFNEFISFLDVPYTLIDTLNKNEIDFK